MNRRYRLYQIQKSTGKDNHRQLFKKVKYEVYCMTKSAYNAYLHSLGGILTQLAPAQILKSFSASSKTADRTPKAVHPSRRMNNCKSIMFRWQISIMFRWQISLNFNSNRCSPLSPPYTQTALPKSSGPPGIRSSKSRKYPT